MLIFGIRYLYFKKYFFYEWYTLSKQRDYQQTSSSRNSTGSIWSPEPPQSTRIFPPAHQRWNPEERVRPRWGERGVGVGHLWEPGNVEPGSAKANNNSALPPSWVTHGENSLPGTTNNKTEQKYIILEFFVFNIKLD